MAGAKLLNEAMLHGQIKDYLSCLNLRQTSQADFSRSSGFLSGLDRLGAEEGGVLWTQLSDIPVKIKSIHDPPHPLK